MKLFVQEHFTQKHELLHLQIKCSEYSNRILCSLLLCMWNGCEPFLWVLHDNAVNNVSTDSPLFHFGNYVLQQVCVASAPVALQLMLAHHVLRHHNLLPKSSLNQCPHHAQPLCIIGVVELRSKLTIRALFAKEGDVDVTLVV